ncbi:hypothetical protein H5410_053177 [Solanum commersonii]|uniref:SWIM-type domain-containing protein n=1 Tax=Solanum commersonii TaxID=4109 RepID=A0A9J5X5P5_SOLCO|nr:hypothetical protein H5410_053177 [Solanum commersonii]
MVRGDPTESYVEIPRYLHMLTQSNPGSIVSLQKTVDGYFQYAFVALNSSIQGWVNCRPVVIVDGSFLKAAYHGTFLTASCQDAGVNRIDHRVKAYLYEIGYSNGQGHIPHCHCRESLPTTLPVGRASAKYESVLTDNLEIALHMMVRPSSDYLHTVTHMGKTFIVCIKAKTCTCRQFQLDELPCPHALAVLHKKGLDGDDYSSLYYTKENMMKTYDIPIHPMPDESTWDLPQEVIEEILLHPIGNKVPGRPRKKRQEKVWKSTKKNI